MRRGVCKKSGGTYERRCQEAQSEEDKGEPEAQRQVAKMIGAQQPLINRIESNLTSLSDGKNEATTSFRTSFGNVLSRVDKRLSVTSHSFSVICDQIRPRCCSVGKTYGTHQLPQPLLKTRLPFRFFMIPAADSGGCPIHDLFQIITTKQFQNYSDEMAPGLCSARSTGGFYFRDHSIAK
jgi:hypothetical protein